MKVYLGVLSIISFLLLASISYGAKIESVGFIKSVSGNAFIMSPSSTVPAVPNMKINLGDSVKTGKESSVGLIFEDDTVVSVGQNSEVKIEEFMFNPIDQELSFVMRMVAGTFSFITGQIAKLAPQRVRFETPDATLGVRGTKLLVKID